MFDLKNKHCLVTGGTKGIGRAVVQTLAAAAAKVYTCSRNQKELDETLAALADKGLDTQGCVCDISDQTSLKKMMDNVEEAFDGKLNILVNSAGMYVSKTIVEYPQDAYDKHMDTNLRSVYTLSRLCHPLLKASGVGSVVNIGSINGTQRVSDAGLPAMTKAAIHQLTRTLACEWATDNIRVNVVAPGIIKTYMTRKFRSDEKRMAMWSRECPMRRIGQPEEIANAVAFLSSGYASFITGQVLCVDGGYSVRGLGY